MRAISLKLSAARLSSFEIRALAQPMVRRHEIDQNVARVEEREMLEQQRFQDSVMLGFLRQEERRIVQGVQPELRRACDSQCYSYRAVRGVVWRLSGDARVALG